MKNIKIFILPIILFLFLTEATAQDYYQNWTQTDSIKKDKIALIIANSHYKSQGSLLQPIPTAKRLEKTLNKLDFDILVGRDLNRKQMLSILQDFSTKYSKYEFAMIIYMGHGFEISGQNFLIPIDANPFSKDDVETEAIKVDYLLKKINNPKIPKIVVLDACRNNPFLKNWSSKERASTKNGFNEVNTIKNTEIFFTTQKSSFVKDNNPYMTYFMEELNKEICLDDLKRNLYNKILTYNPNQIPATYGQLGEKICFNSRFMEHQASLNEWIKKGDTHLSNEDFNEAIYWYQKAAKKGHPKADAYIKKTVSRKAEIIKTAEQIATKEIKDNTLITEGEVLYLVRSQSKHGKAKKPRYYKVTFNQHFIREEYIEEEDIKFSITDIKQKKKKYSSQYFKNNNAKMEEDITPLTIDASPKKTFKKLAGEKCDVINFYANDNWNEVFFTPKITVSYPTKFNLDGFALKYKKVKPDESLTFTAIKITPKKINPSVFELNSKTANNNLKK